MLIVNNLCTFNMQYVDSYITQHYLLSSRIAYVIIYMYSICEHIKDLGCINVSTLGQRIKGLRLQHHLNQEQLGKVMGVKKATISNYELGTRKPDPDDIVKLANYFETTTDYLLGNTDNSELPNTTTDLLAAHLDKAYSDLSDDDKNQIQDFIKYIQSKGDNK